jgi:hypothetical protein
MKQHLRTSLILSLLCTALFGTGCEKNTSQNPQDQQTTNAQATATPAPTPVEPVINNAYTAQRRGASSMKDLQVLLTTELSKGSKVVALGRGLYFFAENDDAGLEMVTSYLHEHTNLTFVDVVSARENFGKVWYTGDDTGFDFKYFPENLNVSNGVFAVFRDR